MRTFTLALLLLAVPALAEPDLLLDGPLNDLRGSPTTTRYPIWGSFGDIPAGFQGPPGDDGKPTAGSATPNLGYSATVTNETTAKQDRTCPHGVRFTATASATLTWSLTWTITLPEWKDSGNASAAQQAEWERFLKAVRVHEEGHVAVGDKAFADAKPAASLGPFTASDCDAKKAMDAAGAALEATIAAEFDRVAKAINDAGEKYDKDTGHGATQGATLNGSVP